MLLSIFKILISIATIGIGVLPLIKPKTIFKFTGLKATGQRGITEIRVIFGGVFIALGTSALILNDFRHLGLMYLLISMIRLISMLLIDKSTSESSNLISFISEVVLGIILIL